MDHAEEAVGQLIIAGGDSAVDLEMAEDTFGAIALLVERPVIIDCHAAVCSTRNDGLNRPFGEVSADKVGIIALVCKEGVGCAFGQIDQGIALQSAASPPVRMKASGRPRASARQ